MAATPAIGVAIGDGKITLDQRAVPGNATVFDGSVLETAAMSTRVVLQGGTNIELGATSRGVFYRDHLRLEKGASQFDSHGPYQIEALSLKIAAAATSSARVALAGSDVQVAALRGAVQVVNAQGILIATLAAGENLEFSPGSSAGASAGAVAPSRVTGCVATAGGHYLLKDETSNVKFELQGANAASLIGKQVEVVGSIPSETSAAEGASSVLHIFSAKVLSKHCASSAKVTAGSVETGTGAGAATTATAAGTGAGTTAATTAVIAGVGVVVVGTVAKVVAGSLADKPMSPTSR